MRAAHAWRCFLPLIFSPPLAFIGDKYNIPHSSFLSYIRTQFTMMSAGLLSHFSSLYTHLFHSLPLSPHFSRLISSCAFDIYFKAGKLVALTMESRRFSSQRCTVHCEVNHLPCLLSLLRCVR